MGWWRCQSQVVCSPVAARAEAENRTKAAARQMVSLNELNAESAAARRRSGAAATQQHDTG
ncbi:MAG: hypothetical protein DME25_16200 [Verrucomicrobia bacterium]|nr:MAG: hypothetical protein DME25_16200 [Verrucomicrobiota bacterium]